MPSQSTPEHESTTGARPTGTSSPTAAAANIQEMFDTIAPTYDRANHILSFSLDRMWWNRAACAVRHILERPEAVVLDLCCGTGDMTLALYQYRAKPAANAGSMASGTVAPMLAVDFSHNMLELARPKFANRNIQTIEADALHLPMESNSVDLVTAAFGFRNLADYPAGLAELHRILRPGGEIAILEANQPDGLTGALYSLYFKRILPLLGGLISGNRSAYAYLPDSVGRFPRPPRMKELIADAGFSDTTWDSYTFGTAGLYRARKP